MALGDIALSVVAIFFPPIPVYLKTGCGAELLINILLCCLCWFPGTIHAWYVIFTTPSQHHNHQRHSRSTHHSRSSSRASGQAPLHTSEHHGHLPSSHPPHAPYPPPLNGREIQQEGHGKHHHHHDHDHHHGPAHEALRPAHEGQRPLYEPGYQGPGSGPAYGPMTSSYQTGYMPPPSQQKPLNPNDARAWHAASPGLAKRQAGLGMPTSAPVMQSAMPMQPQSQPYPAPNAAGGYGSSPPPPYRGLV